MHPRSTDAQHPIGIESRVERIKTSLKSETSCEVRVLGMYGMGGIGKTTLANAVYSHISEEFEGSCRLLNIRESPEQPNGLTFLQKKFFPMS